MGLVRGSLRNAGVVDDPAHLYQAETEGNLVMTQIEGSHGKGWR
jgi:hypothetical protein